MIAAMTIEGSNAIANGWRFGEFVLWPARRRLLRDGVPVTIEERPFDLLVLLTTHWDRPLNRGEVTVALWGPRPVSDNTLRQLVYKARQAVGDDGEQQSVIRTLHGRSLQWVAPLEPIVDTSPVVNLPATDQASAPRARWNRPWRWGIAGLVVAVGAAGFFLPRAQVPARVPVPRIAVEPFDNASGDTSLDWVDNGLSALVASLLSQRGGADVVDPLHAAQVWGRKPPQGRSQEQQLRLATGASVLIGGHLSKLTADDYALHVVVTRDQAEPVTLTLSGNKPSLLAVNAVAGIRRALGLAEPITPERLPHDPFLATAFARGEDFAIHGQWKQARDDFRVVVDGAPGFLPAALDLGITLARTNDLPGGEAMLSGAVNRAAAQGDVQTQAKALLYLGNLARGFDRNPQAQAWLVQAIDAARKAGDVEGEIKAHVLLADVLHKLQKRDASHDELQRAETMVTQHPALLSVRSLLYTTQGSIAGDEGDQTGALKAEQAALDSYTALGDEANSVVSEFNIANTLRNLHRDVESLRMSVRCRQRAVGDEMLGLEFACGANLAANLVDLGLTEQAIDKAQALLPIALKLHSMEYQVLAYQLRSLGEIEQGDYSAALTDLHKGDALTDVSKLEYATFLDQEIYTAIAAFEAAPYELPAMSQRFDAIAKDRLKDEGYTQRRAMLRALAAAAQKHWDQTLAHLHEAAIAAPLAADGGFEMRMPPLLIAIAHHDAAVSEIALRGYDPSHAEDADLLPLYIRWAGQIGDSQGVARATARLEELRKQGRDAMRIEQADSIDPSSSATRPLDPMTLWQIAHSVGYNKRSSSGISGRLRTRTVVAAKTAFASAGAVLAATASLKAAGSAPVSTLNTSTLRGAWRMCSSG